MTEEQKTPSGVIEGEKIIEGGSGDKKNKNKWLYAALILVVLWLIFGKKQPATEENNQLIDSTNVANATDQITDANNQQNLIDNSGLKEVKISDSYLPVADVYSNPVSYKNNTFKLALKGDFDKLKLTVKAKVNNDLKNSVSLNVGMFSGVYQYYGKDLQFDKDNNLDLVLDLKEKADFNTGSGVVLWNYVEPDPAKDSATVVRLYATTVDQNGKYANQTEITDFKLEYSCSASDPDCTAVVCGDQYQTGGGCLVDKFGADAAKKYIEYFNKK